MASKKNFRIVENSPPKYLERYDEFLELYFNPEVFKRDILLELDWSENQYQHARKKAIRDGLIQPRTKVKHYYYNKSNGKYIVNKCTRNIHFAHTVDTEEEAKAMVEYLRKYGWTKQNAYKFKKQYRGR